MRPRLDQTIRSTYIESLGTLKPWRGIPGCFSYRSGAHGPDDIRTAVHAGKPPITASGRFAPEPSALSPSSSQVLAQPNSYLHHPNLERFCAKQSAASNNNTDI